MRSRVNAPSTLLLVHDGGAVAGTLEQSAGRTTLRYEDTWRRSPAAIALSLSLPLSKREHDHPRVDAFLWGLLPDNELVLERWGRQFQVSSRNAFRLLAHVGEDCPGAFQLVSPERYPSLRDDAGGVQWLSARQVEQRLAAIRIDPSRTRAARDRGQFSLAGAQPKIALYREGARWGVPHGRTPTTHILKPPSADLDGFAENEHFCLRLAQRVGFAVARSEVLRFGDETAIVVERYDRAWTAALAASSTALAAAEAANVEDPSAAARAAEHAARSTALARLAEARPILRLHQEDLCQALGVHPARKYQNEGGPTPLAIVQLIRAASARASDDAAAFVDALAFHRILGGTDAHAKNYSLLHAGGGSVRLAPLYDVASALPYPRLQPRKLKLAMSIGGEYGMHAIHARHVAKLASELRLDEAATVARFRALAEAVEQHAPTLREELRAEGLTSPILDPLASAIGRRAAQCAARLR